MSLFEDLCKKYSDKREREIDFARKSGLNATQFASSFQKYINAPDSFSTKDDSGREQQHKLLTLLL